MQINWNWSVQHYCMVMEKFSKTKNSMGVPDFMEGSLISYKIGDPRVPKILENWGPGSLILYENGDPRVPKILGNWGPGSLILYENGDPGSPFSHDTGPDHPRLPQCMDTSVSTWHQTSCCRQQIHRIFFLSSEVEAAFWVIVTLKGTLDCRTRGRSRRLIHFYLGSSAQIGIHMPGSRTINRSLGTRLASALVWFPDLLLGTRLV